MHLELRGNIKKATRRWEKARLGLDYKIVNKFIYSLESGYISEGSEKRYLKGVSIVQNGQGLLKQR